MGNKFIRRLKWPDNAKMKPESWNLAVGVFNKKKGSETVVNSHWIKLICKSANLLC